MNTLEKILNDNMITGSDETEFTKLDNYVKKLCELYDAKEAAEITASKYAFQLQPEMAMKAFQMANCFHYQIENLIKEFEKQAEV